MEMTFMHQLKTRTAKNHFVVVVEPAMGNYSYHVSTRREITAMFPLHGIIPIIYHVPALWEITVTMFPVHGN